MHLIVAGNAYPEYHKNFVKWVKSREYAGNKHKNFGIKVREVKLYDISFPKEIEQPFLKDLKYFQRFQSTMFVKAIKFISKFVNCNKKLEPIDMDKIIPSTSQEVKVPLAPNDFWVYLSILGKVDDGHANDNEKREFL